MAFYAATRSSLLLKTRKFVLSLNKTVLDLQSNKKKSVPSKTTLQK